MVWPFPRARRRPSAGQSPARRAVMALAMGALAGIVVAAVVPRRSGPGRYSA